MPDFLQAISSSLEKWGLFIYLLAFAVAFAESLVVVGHFIPGAVFLAFLGFLCFLGIFDPAAMLAAVFAAHFLGELANYALGKYKASALFHEKSRYFKPELLARIGEEFRARRLRLLFIGQFIGMVRPFVPFIAGTTRYPLRRLIFPLALADFIWALAHLGIGFVLGAGWQRAPRYLADFSLFVFAAAAAMWLGVRIIGRKRRARSGGDPSA